MRTSKHLLARRELLIDMRQANDATGLVCEAPCTLDFPSGSKRSLSTAALIPQQNISRAGNGGLWITLPQDKSDFSLRGSWLDLEYLTCNNACYLLVSALSRVKCDRNLLTSYYTGLDTVANTDNEKCGGFMHFSRAGPESILCI